MKRTTTGRPARIVLLEDDQRDVDLIREVLRSAAPDVDLVVASDGPTFERLLAEDGIDVVLADYHLPGYDGTRAFEFARNVCPRTPFIFVSGTIGEDSAIDLVRGGATDYVLKSRLGRLVPAIRRALLELDEREAREYVEAELERRARQQFVIADLARKSLDRGPLQELFESAVSQVAAVYDVDFAAITEQRGEDQLVVVAGVGWESDVVGTTVFPAGPTSLAGHALELGRVVTSEDVTADERLRPLPRLLEHGVRSGMSAPVVGLGAISVYSRTIRYFDELECGFLGAIATVLAHAVQRKRDQESLATSEERLRLILSQISDALFLVNEVGRVTYATPSAAELTGVSTDDLLDRSIDDLLGPDASTLLDCDQITEVMGLERTVRRADGTQREVLMDVRCIPGSPDRTLYLCRDVTERRELEQRVRQTEKMEAIGQLAGGIAHDFNNMLSVIQGHAEMAIAAGDDQARMQRHVDALMSAAERSGALTSQLLSFGRRQLLRPEVVELDDLVEESVKLLDRVIGEDIDLRVRTRSGGARVEIDPQQLQQTILNMAINSRHAMPSGGQLRITTSSVELDDETADRRLRVEPGRYVVMVVEDDGVGMDEETRSRVFEPFFTTRKAGEGTGLGLSTVHGFVRQSGGAVTVYSEPGQGTTFRVYLPMVADAKTPSVARKLVTPSGGSESILLVEDEELVRSLLAEMLELAGYTVHAAKDGETALALLDSGVSIDLLFTDVVMPGMSGRELADQVLSRHPDVGVVYSSGYTEDSIVRRGVARENIHFVQKPIQRRKLLEVVRDALDR